MRKMGRSVMSLMRKNNGERPRIERKQLFSYMLIFAITPILTYAIGRWLDSRLSLPMFPPYPLNLLVGFGVFFTGLAIGIKSTRLLHKEGFGLPWGEVRRNVQSMRLVTTGPYAYTRNPMVLGYSMLPLGMGVMFKSLGMALPTSTFVIIANIILVKIKEEPKLEERFGDEYREYRRKTPFLIPRVGPLIRGIIDLIHGHGKGTRF